MLRSARMLRRLRVLRPTSIPMPQWPTTTTCLVTTQATVTIRRASVTSTTPTMMAMMQCLRYWTRTVKRTMASITTPTCQTSLVTAKTCQSPRLCPTTTCSISTTRGSGTRAMGACSNPPHLQPARCPQRRRGRTKSFVPRLRWCVVRPGRRTLQLRRATRLRPMGTQGRSYRLCRRTPRGWQLLGSITPRCWSLQR